ncbi:MAG: hypothetical protein KAQ74_03700 [Dehalococcoidia bacterium]|nr:hypothetical protein [Dehalococcoidia bacterium]
MDTHVQEHNGQNGPDGHQEKSNTPSIPSTFSIPAEAGGHAEVMAHGALALIARTVSLIDRQMSSQDREVQHESRIAESIRRKHLSKRG